ncbi:MAG: LLM class flavin-dependent oxidoreductase [Bacillota bacterium]
MRLSILDQAPIASGQTAREALLDSLRLAQAGENLGYSRYWIAEHHDLSGLACSAPEVMLSYIGANTNHIRIGAGAVLLPHYKPYKVAELYNMLATLFPGRVDIGIGRAPGGSAEATNALSDNYLQQVWKLPELISDLLHFLDDDFVTDNEHASLSASPIPQIAPEPWLLGTGKKSAEVAAKVGLPYAFGQFMSQSDGVALVKQYRDEFIPRKEGERSQVILTVSAICADSSEKAEEIALSSLVWGVQREKGKGQQGVPSINESKEYPLSEKELHTIENQKQNMIIGNPQEVALELRKLQALYQADEIMIVTITNSIEDRIHSYELIMGEIKK